MQVEVRLANVSDLDRAADVLGCAFADYPWTRWTVDPDDHQRRITALQRMALEHYGLPFGKVWAATIDGTIAGLDTPDSGEIRVAERDLAHMSQRELARFRNQKIGLIFQAYHLLHELDALENVCFAGRMARRSAGELEKRARELLSRVGLKGRIEHRPYELSGGEQQRVAIARALINDPELIIADEPTGNLDSHTGEEIVDLLCALRDERQATLIIATHDSKVAARAPRVIRLVDGQVELT